MKYPQLNSWLQYKKKDDFTYLVKDYMTDQVYLFDIEDVRFFRKLDGKTNPYEINPDWSEYEVKKLMRFLKKKELVRNSRISKSFLSIQISLFKLKFKRTGKAIALKLNRLLLMSFLPVLLIGIFYYINYSSEFFITDYLSVWLGLMLGTVAGLLLHETGHALAGAGYGARVFECGLIVGLSSGAYVMIDFRNVKKRIRRVQILAAGIEMNFLLVGISLILAGLIDQLSGFFIGFAFGNLVLGIVNLLFINGLDGCSIIKELLSTQSLSFSALDFIIDEKVRRGLLMQGATGYIKIASCFIGAVFQLAYPLLLIVNVVGVISCII